MDLIGLTLDFKLYANHRLNAEAMRLKIPIQWIDPLGCTLLLDSEGLQILQTHDIHRVKLKKHRSIKKVNKQTFLWTRLTNQHAPSILAVASTLETFGAKAINSSFRIEQALNKFKTFQTLANHKLPVAPCFFSSFATQSETTYELYQQSPFDKNKIILKPQTGNQGTGVHQTQINSFQSAIDLYRLAEKDFLSQPFFQGRNIRVLCCFQKALGAIELKTSPRDFRSNASKQGQAKKIKLTSKAKHICEAIAQTLNLNFCGIDLIEDKDKNIVIIDVNANPGFEAFEKATQINIAQVLLTELSQQE